MPSGRKYLSLVKVLLSIYFCRMAFHKERNHFWLVCCFTGEELAENLGARTSLTYGNKEYTLYLSLLFLLRDKKEKKIHGLCFITYSCLD